MKVWNYADDDDDHIRASNREWPGLREEREVPCSAL